MLKINYFFMRVNGQVAQFCDDEDINPLRNTTLNDNVKPGIQVPTYFRSTDGTVESYLRGAYSLNMHHYFFANRISQKKMELHLRQSVGSNFCRYNLCISKVQG